MATIIENTDGQRPKNVVLMVADDLGRQLGCYGNGVVKSPRLDALAAQGTKFTCAFASTASCSCSRSTLYTGLHVHQNGQYGLNNQRHHFTTFDHVETGPALLNERGYLTAIVGKVHVGPDHVYPWQIREESETRDVAVVADRAAAVFSRARKENKPFFLTVGFIDPHRDRTRGGFGNEGEVFDHRVQRVSYDPADVVVPPFLSDLPGTRQELATYYESISRMDQGVGMILDELETAGVDDDTLVIFLSDNGPPFINSKTTLYDAGVNLPLIVRYPGTSSVTAAKGITNPNMVSWVDILPTILDYTGGAANPTSNPGRLGRSILPVLHSTDALPGWDRVFGSHTFHEITNYWPTRYVRNRRYKYHRNLAWRLDFPFAADIYGSLSWEDIRNADAVVVPPSGPGAPATNGDTAAAYKKQRTPPPQKMIGNRPLRSYFFRPPEELYDLEADPFEVHNLVSSAATDKNRASRTITTKTNHQSHEKVAAAVPEGEAGAGAEGVEEVLTQLRAELEAWQRRTDDPWLYRDGVSVLLVQHHLDAGLRMPDRVDFDVEDVATTTTAAAAAGT